MSASVKVSIIIAAYEAAEYIHTAIASCLSQSETLIEVIVVDDASEVSLEGTVKTAAQGDERVKFFRLGRNSGPSGARNRALDEACGEYVAVLDADDAMRPDRLEKMLACAQKHSADIVVDNMIANRVDDAPGLEAPFLNQAAISGDMTIGLEVYADPSSNQRFGQALGYLKPLIRRASLNVAGLRYDTQLTNSEDYYLIAELLARGAKMTLTQYMGYIYTIQAGSISHRLTPDQASAIFAAEKAFQLRYFGSVSTQLKKAGRRRLKAIQRDYQFETLIEDLRAKSILDFVGHVLKFLPNTFAHMGKFIRIAMKRVG